MCEECRLVFLTYLVSRPEWLYYLYYGHSGLPDIYVRQILGGHGITIKCNAFTPQTKGAAWAAFHM